MGLKIIWKVYRPYSDNKKKGHTSEFVAEKFYELLKFIVFRWDVIVQEIFPMLNKEDQDGVTNALRALIFYGEDITKIMSEDRKSFIAFHKQFIKL